MANSIKEQAVAILVLYLQQNLMIKKLQDLHIHIHLNCCIFVLFHSKQ